MKSRSVSGGVFMLFVAATLACNLSAATPTPPPTQTPTSLTPTPAAAPASIGGRLWHDLCDPGPDGGPAPTAAPSGCTGEPGSGYRANGVYEAGEPFIANVVVGLGEGACPSTGLAETATAMTDPSYMFSGLKAGTYCITIDPLAEPNVSILIPGGWTHPLIADGAINATVTVAAGESRTDVDFGWDYQFLPAPGAATATQIPTAGPTAAPTIVPTAAAGQPQRVNFPPGGVSATLVGHVQFPDRIEYLVGALAGQQMGIEIQSAGDAANFAIVGEDGTPYKRLENESRQWTGRLNTAQDYTISVAVPGGAADYTLRIAILPAQGAAILGFVWNDYCTLPAGNAPSAGCVADGQGGYWANGIVDNGELGIAGVTVVLKSGACPAGGEISTAITNVRGEYYFSGLAAGAYCVLVDPLRPQNEPILPPGDWSYPTPGQDWVTVTLAEEEVAQNVNFGWDFQLD